MLASETSNFLPCQEELDHPFAMIPNNLLRNKDLSIECRWLISYLLSHSGKWKISIPYIIKTQNISKNRIYPIINEAIEAGYVKREENIQNGLKRYTYFVSRQPKFKKILPCPQNQDTENEDTKEDQPKEYQSLPPNPQTWGHPPISPKGEQKSASPSEKRDRVKEKKEEKASFVFLTPAQHESLLKRLQGDELMLKMCYQKLSDWKISKGARGGNDYLTIIKWVIGAVEKDVQEAKTTVSNPVEDNWQKNQMLVQELKTAFPHEAGGLHFYYKDRILKDKNDRTFDVIGYLDHKDFIKVLEKHLRIQITE